MTYRMDATKYNIAQQALMAHLRDCLTSDEYSIADKLIEEMARETHKFQTKANHHDALVKALEDFLKYSDGEMPHESGERIKIIATNTLAVAKGEPQ